MVTQTDSLVRRRQAPRRARYARAPEEATIVKRARTMLDLGVEVTATLDVRGTLGLDCGVPVTARTHLDAAG